MGDFYGCDGRFVGPKEGYKQQRMRFAKGMGRREAAKSDFRPLPKDKAALGVPKCPVCGIFSEHLRRHMQRVHTASTTELKCELCGIPVKRRDNLMRHMRKAHPDGKAGGSEKRKEGKFRKCDVCAKEVKNLADHKRKVHDQRPNAIFTCPHCPARYALHTKLQNHLKRQHKTDPNRSITDFLEAQAVAAEQKRKCPQCGMLVALSSWRGHFEAHGVLHPHKDHKRRRNFRCACCARAFLRKTHLVSHIATHLKQQREAKVPGKNNRECEICHDLVRQKDYGRHIRSHVKETLWRCKCCRKGFMRQTSRNIHEGQCVKAGWNMRETLVRERDGGKIKCYRCTRWISACNFAGHRRMHFGEKIHKCTTCSKAFTYVKNLRVHEKIHTAGAFPCPNSLECRTFKKKGPFRTKNGLHYHLKRHPECAQVHKGMHSISGTNELEWNNKRPKPLPLDPTEAYVGLPNFDACMMEPKKVSKMKNLNVLTNL